MARTRTPHVWCPFIIIVLGFALVNCVSIYEMRQSQAQVTLITKHAANDIELIARLSRDLDRKRTLVEDHIFEKESRDMQRIETELAAIDTEVAEAAQAYQPVGDDAEERSVWHDLDQQIAAIEPDIIETLALSRRNMDDEAQAIRKTLQEPFNRIDQATGRLLKINHARADHEAGEVRRLQRRAVLILAFLTLVGTIFALLTARWVISLLSDREAGMTRAMNLLTEHNRELDAFAGRVAHDLRGPLSTVNLASAQFKMRAVYDESAGEILQRAVTRMEAMIQDLLTLSRVGVQTKGVNCRMADVIGAVEEDLKPAVEREGGTLRIQAGDATIPCSPGLLREVLWNLGENAVKYRRPETPLTLEIIGRATPDGYLLTVSDNGTGMSLFVVRQAFEPFFRGKGSECQPGTGLGLSVVKRVLDSFGGTVSIESEVGHGTTVKLWMPREIQKAA